jgi:hypothetical protein
MSCNAAGGVGGEQAEQPAAHRALLDVPTRTL